MAGTTRLELATSAVTVSGLSVLSTTWKSTDGTVSHWKYIEDTAIVYRDVYRVASVNRTGRVVSGLPVIRKSCGSLPTSRIAVEQQTSVCCIAPIPKDFWISNSMLGRRLENHSSGADGIEHVSEISQVSDRRVCREDR